MNVRFVAFYSFMPQIPLWTQVYLISRVSSVSLRAPSMNIGMTILRNFHQNFRRNFHLGNESHELMGNILQRDDRVLPRNEISWNLLYGLLLETLVVQTFDVSIFSDSTFENFCSRLNRTTLLQFRNELPVLLHKFPKSSISSINSFIFVACDFLFHVFSSDLLVFTFVS